jgi:hypothetical protein
VIHERISVEGGTPLTYKLGAGISFCYCFQHAQTMGSVLGLDICQCAGLRFQPGDDTYTAFGGGGGDRYQNIGRIKPRCQFRKSARWHGYDHPLFLDLPHTFRPMRGMGTVIGK